MKDEPIEPVAAIWSGLKAHLADRFRELHSEIRHYPTPIARCDDQLPKLIEQRDHARKELERMTGFDAAWADPDTPPPGDIARFLSAATPCDDEIEYAFRSRLQAALSPSRR